jgi:type I site-specific restriction endonuclease
MPAAGSTSSLNEAQARYVLIDPALDKAGWKLHDRTQVGLEALLLMKNERTTGTF